MEGKRIMKHKRRLVKSANDYIKIVKIIFIFLLLGFIINALTYICCTLIGWPGNFNWLWDTNLSDFSEMMKFVVTTTAIPYLALGILWLIILRNEKVESYNHKKAGLIGALIGIALINILLYSSYYLDLLIGDVSSTGGLVFLFFPFYALIFGVIGFLIGYVISLKIKGRREESDYFESEGIWCIEMAAEY